MKGLGPIIIVEDDKEDQEVLAEVLKELEIQNEIKFFKERNKCFNLFTNYLGQALYYHY